MTNFTPPTYESAHPAHDGSKVPCDKCGRKVWGWVLQDMRGLPGVVGDWLCDGCRSTLYRTLTPIDGGTPPKTRREWRERLMKAHGAPKAALAKVRAMRDTGADKDKSK